MVVSSNNPGNLEGILIFAKEVLPCLRESYPDLNLRIVGGPFPGSFLSIVSKLDGVVLLGRVDDLSVAYKDCLMSVAPVAYGAGTSIKVLESFSHGRLCVMNAFASEGLKACPNIYFKCWLPIASA